jgi:predicted Zn-dependent peptidase
VIKKEIKYNKSDKSFKEFDIDLITENNKFAKVFAFAICIKTGSRNEQSEINGISHLLEHLIFKRSNRKSAKQIANKFEELGALANAFTSKENIVFYVRGLNENIKPIMNLMFEIVYNAKFIAKEVEKEKLIIIDEINTYDDDAEESIYEIGEKLVFDNNPLSYTITGDKKTLNNIDLNLLNDYYNKNFHLDNSKFTFIGNFEESEIKNLIWKLFSKNSNNTIVYIPESKSKITDKEIKIVNQTIIKDFSQSHLLYLLPFV